MCIDYIEDIFFYSKIKVIFMILNGLYDEI